jgi:hypothetical protein
MPFKMEAFSSLATTADSFVQGEFDPFDDAKPRLSRRGRKRRSGPALSEAEGVNLEEAPAFRPGRFTFLKIP